MKHAISLSSLLAFGLCLWASLASANNNGRIVVVDVQPLIPVNCYDGQAHVRLNRIDNITMGEDAENVYLAFRNYFLDCGLVNGVLRTNTYGPYHEKRCDHSVRPHPGVSLYTEMVPLQAEGGMIEACGALITFRKADLPNNPGLSRLEYVQRYDSTLGEYIWLIGIGLDATTNRYSVAQLALQGYGNNLDRTTRGYMRTCTDDDHYEAVRHDLRAYSIESPVAKVEGDFLKVSYFFTALKCMAGPDGHFSWRKIRSTPWSEPKMILTSSVGSPIGYDWKVYEAYIDYDAIQLPTPDGRERLEYIVNHNDIRFADVIAEDQKQAYCSGRVAQAVFKVYSYKARASSPHGGYVRLVLNLDPRIDPTLNICRNRPPGR